MNESYLQIVETMPCVAKCQASIKYSVLLRLLYVALHNMTMIRVLR